MRCRPQWGNVRSNVSPHNPALNYDGIQSLERAIEYRLLMEDADRDVLEFVGDQGKTAEELVVRFPAFDLEHLVRAELIRPRRTNPFKSQSRSAAPAPDPTFYVLTSRGAEAIGLDQHTLHSD